MDGKPYIFLDLDDSIFQTRRKCPGGESLRPAAVDREGRPNSWMTRQQQILFQMLESTGTIIPTTARSHDAFQRVTLSFHHVAILSFGGVVLLPNGDIDPAWDATIRPRVSELESRLQQAYEEVREFAKERFPGVYARIIEDFGMSLYLVLKHREADSEALRAIASSGVLPADDRWFLHINDNNLALVPRFLGKEHAVKYVMQHHLDDQPPLTLGVGDSLSDAGFLGLCDYAITPKESQLQSASFETRC